MRDTNARTPGTREPAASTKSSVRFWHPPEGHFPSGVWFGVPTREGGASAGPYASLNLGLRVGDDERAVHENRRRLREAAGMGDREPTMVHQVHGARIVTTAEAARGGIEADGILAAAGDPWIGVTVADCAPVAIVEPGATRAALLHCGWRGAHDGIPAAAVARLAEEGFEPAFLLAAIGPCLHACCFPIGPEVAAQFDASHLRPHPTGQPSLDLPGAIVAGLVRAGMAPERILAASECTALDPARWFSHRRDKGVTGRHWALLRISPPR